MTDQYIEELALGFIKRNGPTTKRRFGRVQGLTVVDRVTGHESWRQGCASQVNLAFERLKRRGLIVNDKNTRCWRLAG